MSAVMEVASIVFYLISVKKLFLDEDKQSAIWWILASIFLLIMEAAP